MALHFMPGVNLRSVSPQSVLAMVVANECFRDEKEDCIITSVTRPGTFLEVGYHGRGDAVDIAVRRMNRDAIPDAVVSSIHHQIDLRIGRLDGGQYDVIWERDASASAGWTGPHIHIEFDPK